MQLLRTKLYRPRPTRDLVDRPRLREMLNRYLDRTVTLVCAPAGFGKTTLLTDWLEQCPCPSAWLSLDERDCDLGVFLAYFVAAVRTAFPSACTNTLALLAAPVLPPAAALVTALANDLDVLADDNAAGQGSPEARPFILVLDDYHLVTEPAIHSFLRELLRYPPRTLHLVISTRQDPPFLGHALRARGDFSEVRSAELRFTTDEAAGFMQQLLPTPLGPEPLATLVERTEGWGTGLRLTALTLEAGGDALRPELLGANRYTFDYLLEEVLAHVPSATEDFLLRTSILDRLTGPLCDALVPPGDSDWDGAAYLKWLSDANVFTFSMDAQESWYRYHHVFQKLLRTQLERRVNQEEIAGLHGRAAAWYGANGLVREAIEHALAAGDEMAAVQLVGKHRDGAMNREHWRELEQWLDLLPRRLIDARPELLMAEAWLLQNRERFGELPAHLDRIEAMMKQPASGFDLSRLRVEADTLRGMTSDRRAARYAAHGHPERSSFPQEAAASKDSYPPLSAASRLTPPGLSQSPEDRLIEPLSQREMEVLQLMNERLSHKEIAEELFISPQTVKRHAANIYQKLAVNGRRDAVARAAECGLLPPAQIAVRRLALYYTSQYRQP